MASAVQSTSVTRPATIEAWIDTMGSEWAQENREWLTSTSFPNEIWKYITVYGPEKGSSRYIEKTDLLKSGILWLDNALKSIQLASYVYHDKDERGNRRYKLVHDDTQQTTSQAKSIDDFLVRFLHPDAEMLRLSVVPIDDNKLGLVFLKTIKVVLPSSQNEKTPFTSKFVGKNIPYRIIPQRRARRKHPLLKRFESSDD